MKMSPSDDHTWTEAAPSAAGIKADCFTEGGALAGVALGNSETESFDPRAFRIARYAPPNRQNAPTIQRSFLGDAP